MAFGGKSWTKYWSTKNNAREFHSHVIVEVLDIQHMWLLISFVVGVISSLRYEGRRP